jgi:hypothetical protein
MRSVCRVHRSRRAGACPSIDPAVGDVVVASTTAAWLGQSLPRRQQSAQPTRTTTTTPFAGSEEGTREDSHQ